jgi:hypothetical protein
MDTKETKKLTEEFISINKGIIQNKTIYGSINITTRNSDKMELIDAVSFDINEFLKLKDYFIKIESNLGKLEIKCFRERGNEIVPDGGIREYSCHRYKKINNFYKVTITFYPAELTFYVKNNYLSFDDTFFINSYKFPEDIQDIDILIYKNESFVVINKKFLIHYPKDILEISIYDNATLDRGKIEVNICTQKDSIKATFPTKDINNNNLSRDKTKDYELVFNKNNNNLFYAKKTHCYIDNAKQDKIEAYLVNRDIVPDVDYTDMIKTEKNNGLVVLSDKIVFYKDYIKDSVILKTINFYEIIKKIDSSHNFIITASYLYQGIVYIYMASFFYDKERNIVQPLKQINVYFSTLIWALDANTSLERFFARDISKTIGELDAKTGLIFTDINLNIMDIYLYMMKDGESLDDFIKSNITVFNKKQLNKTLETNNKLNSHKHNVIEIKNKDIIVKTIVQDSISRIEQEGNNYINHINISSSKDFHYLKNVTVMNLNKETKYIAKTTKSISTLINVDEKLSFLEGVKQLADFYSSKKIRGNHIIAHNNFNNTPDKIKNCNKRIANYCFCELSYFKPNGPYNNWHRYKDTDIIYYRKDNVKPNLRLRFSYSGGITFGVIGGEGAIGPSTISEKGGLYLKIENSKVKICNFNETLFEHSAAIDINKQTKIVWRPDGLEVNGVKDVFVASAKDVFFKENTPLLLYTVLNDETGEIIDKPFGGHIFFVC